MAPKEKSKLTSDLKYDILPRCKGGNVTKKISIYKLFFRIFKVKFHSTLNCTNLLQKSRDLDLHGEIRKNEHSVENT